MNPNVSEIWSYEPIKKLYAKTLESLKHANFNKPIKVYRTKLKSLNKILGKVRKPVAIKCDIEGDEYSVFDDEADLSKVYAIMMEYHYGFEPIEKDLRAKGFKVSFTKPKHVPMYMSKSKEFDLGYLYAWR
jgi:hypothetical protein